MRRLTGTVISILLCVSLCACGGGAPAGNESQQQSSVVSGGNVGNNSNVPLQISILNETEAEITFMGDGTNKPFTDVTGINVSFGKYSVGLNDFGGSSLQCSIWYSEDGKEHKLVEEGKASYEVESDRITLHVDMKDVAGFSFKNVDGTQELHYEYSGKGGPDVPFDWIKLVDMSRFSVRNGEEPSSSAVVESSSAAPSSSSKPDYQYHFWFMDKDYTTSGGITIRFSNPVLEGVPSKVTIKGAKTISDGTYDFEVKSCIGVDDEKEGFIQGKIKASQVSNIKTEIRTDDGRILMIDIYS